MFQLATIVSCLDNDHYFGRLLLFPEATAYGEDVDDVRLELLRIAERVLPELPLLDLHRRRAVVDLEVREVTVEVPPPSAGLWSSPLTLRFHAVCWDHDNQASIAYLPGLDIEVVARRSEELERLIADHVRFALMRRKAIGCLRSLIWLQRTESVTVETMAAEVDIRTARQVAEQCEATPQKSVLQDVASKLTGASLPPVFELDDLVQQLAEWLDSNVPRSVLLVGPSGVGKTAAVHKLAANGGRTRSRPRPVWSTSGARIVAGMCGLGMWQDRCQELSREAADAEAIVHLGNLMELLQVGQSEGNDLGVGEFLRPAIARGELVAIAECTPEELTLIERMSPGMLEAFVRLDIEEPSRETSQAILRQAVGVYGRSGDVRLDEAALATLDRLHRRYATYSAYPGRPLRFLKHLVEDAPRRRTLTTADVTAGFSRETGLPRQLLDETASLDLEATGDWFRERVIGQDEAVEIIVDLLATIKADLARPDRPLASLMFIGPTGVGKTEMAKTLAEFLYQDRRRLTRIDMSEYADPAAIDRLIGVSRRSEGLLTSKVREQPFGVVLLDEFEKAHPRFFDLLLQVLGEGRLTDGAGRLADFRNSVIIMTSNLGADSFARRAPGFRNEDAVDRETQDHFIAKVRDFLRPEMLNRIDRIVPFLPLPETVLRDIARRELELLRQRDGMRYRPLEVEFDESLAGWLADRFHDPRYGARPLKRAIERHILAVVAESLNEYQADQLLRVHITPGPQRPRVTVRRVLSAERSPGTTVSRVDSANLTTAAGKCTELRRQAMRLQRSHSLQELRNELYRLQREKQRRESRGRQSVRAEVYEQDARTALLEPLAARVDQIVAEAIALEDQVLGACYIGQPVDLRQIVADADSQSALLYQVSFELYALQWDRPDYVTVVAFSDNLDRMRLLARSYYEVAASRGYQTEVYEILPCSELHSLTPDRILLGDRDSKDAGKRRQANETRLLAKRAKPAESPLSSPTAQAIGVALCIKGPAAWLLLQPEEGLHVWQEGSKKQRCLVHVSRAAMPDYQPPFRIDRREGIGNQQVRRIWNRLRKTIDDRRGRGRVFWSGESFGQTLAGLIEQHLRDRVEASTKS